jgi:hypothetical protein
MELLGIHLGDARRGDGSAAETVLSDCHDSVSNACVAVNIDVFGIHPGGAANDHIVDHMRAAPSASPRPLGKTGRPPPGDTRLTPAERHPGDSGRSNADSDAQTTLA